AQRPGGATLSLGRHLHAAAETTPLEDAWAQTPHALQARGAAALALSAVPRGQAAAQSLPALRLLQGPGDRRRGRGLACRLPSTPWGATTAPPSSSGA